MNKHRCFWLTRTGHAHLRVTVQGPGPKKCDYPPFYHSALAEGPEQAVAEFKALTFERVATPTHCTGCGYPFVDTDPQHTSVALVYEGTKPDGTKWRGTLDAAPVGSMFDDVDLAKHQPEDVGPDGRCLFVRTPAGWWPVDVGAEGHRFKREGDVPTITVEGTVTVPNSYGTWSGSLVRGVLITAEGGPPVSEPH